MIDSKLIWKAHYGAVIKKANNVLAFLQRNLSNCPTNIKSECFKTLVRPILEYGCSVWDPHYQTDIQHFERVQKRAARFATGNYVRESGNTKTNMQKLNWKPLEERRAQIKLNLFFKATKTNLVDIPIHHLDLNKMPTRRKNSHYTIPTSNVDSHLYSFYPSTIRLWNTLPASCKQQSSADTFKANIEKNLQ